MQIAICDDDKVHCDILEKYINEFLSEYPNIIITKYLSGEELLAEINIKKFDILLLDIEMTGISGVETAKKIRENDNALIIIFITGYVHHVSDALSADAFQFLVKPVSKELFDRELKRAIIKHQKEHQKYIINLKSGVTVLEINDIFYIESNNREIYIYTKDKKYAKYGKISDEESLLANFGFVRCHQGFLVNMKYIYDIEATDVVLKNGIKIMLSIRKRKEVIAVFNKYLAGVT